MQTGTINTKLNNEAYSTKLFLNKIERDKFLLRNYTFKELKENTITPLKNYTNTELKNCRIAYSLIARVARGPQKSEGVYGTGGTILIYDN